MNQLRNYGDERQTSSCALCGRGGGTRDHVPPRIFLDDPFPENLPVVVACEPCNNGASDDEAYAACFIDCVVVGTVDDHLRRRPKIAKLLARQGPLRSRIAASKSGGTETPVWSPEPGRIEHVVLKIARGLASYELNEPQLGKPANVAAVPFAALSGEQRAAFERISRGTLWPEVGSRAMQRLFTDQGDLAGWIVVQEGRFRYAVLWEGSATIVRMVFSEYLAAEVIWR